MRLNALWVEGDLSYMEKLSLLSALDVGHKITLWTYGRVTGIPNGVDVADASDVMPKTRMIKHRQTQRWDMGSDLFRLELQRKGLGCWIDCDVLLLKPIPDDEYIFGWERKDSIATGVLRLPPNCPIIADVFGLLDHYPIVPPWWSGTQKIKQRVRGLLGKGKHIDKMHRTSLGPKAVTHFAFKHGLEQYALPTEVHYPNHPSNAMDIFHHASLVEKCIKPTTVSVHLWHNEVKGYKHRIPIIPGTFLHKHCSRLGVDVAQPISSAIRQDLRKFDQALDVLEGRGADHAAAS